MTETTNRVPTTEHRSCATRVYAFHCGGDRSGMGVYDPIDEDGGRVVYGPYFFFLVEPVSRLSRSDALQAKTEGAGLVLAQGTFDEAERPDNG